VVESDAEEKVRHLYDRFGRENVTILASFGVVRLVLSAEGDEPAARRRVLSMESAFREVLGEDVAGVDIDGLAEVVLQQLRQRRQTLATAESCTGGLISADLTEVPGSSDVFLGGVVSYSNDIKEGFLDVPHEMLLAHGAVSDEVARAMATGARGRLNADWGIGITGIAGPSGGSEEKPVGLVHWAVAGPRQIESRQRVFLGDRSIIRRWSVNAALDLLRRCLLEPGR
jgi:nicotinamide-nucleotide amidase